MRIWTVDAFADKPYTGNPAAVTVVDTFPADDICQKIAAEMNLSETAFIKPLGRDQFHIRWFTPKVEVKLCGHATLAAAHILFQEKHILGERIVFESHSGPLFVRKEDGYLALDFPLQQTGPDLSLSMVAPLGLNDAAIAVVQAQDDVIVEVVDEETVRCLSLASHDVAKIDCRGLIVTARASTAPFDFVSRFFAPRVGVDEDPVTGSAHCKLAHYWQQKLNKDQMIAYQASTRGGILTLHIRGNRVDLKGHALTVMEGTWKV